MAAFEIPHFPGTHAGELEDETLAEIWDHLYERDEDPKIPQFSERVLSFFRSVNGVKPTRSFAGELQIVRFLNFCNDYLDANAAIADWHVVRVRNWIADRLDPLVIPIAELAHGNYLCLDFSLGDDPRVVYWYHERSLPGKPDYHLVAPSLQPFVDALISQGK